MRISPSRYCNYFLKEVKMKRVLSFIIGLVAALNVSAQNVNVETKIDSIQMFVGEQVHITLTVTMGEKQHLKMPVFKASQYITPGVEVLGSDPADTISLDNNMISVSKKYTLTSFDEKLYYLPPMKVTVDGKLYESKSLALKVLTVNVDMKHPENFFGPKDVQNNPFEWNDWSLIFWFSVLMVILCGIGYYLYLIYKGHKPVSVNIKMIKRLLPHQKAMNEIEQIKANKMVTSENAKEYYTRLTDTLRKYIEDRFGFSAMEMTSSEIISRLQDTGDQKMIEELKGLFRTADLVKFAKYSTLINENDMNLVNAIDFINSTKIENQATAEKAIPQLTEKEKRSRKSRIILRTLILLIVVVCAAMLTYIVYTMLELI